MALSCAEFQLRLDDGERLDGADMREHARSCAPCRLALERWQAAAGQMRAWAQDEPPAFLHTRLMAELRAARAEEGRRRTWRPWRPIWVSAAAAVALVVVGVGLGVFRSVPAPQVPASPSRASAERLAPPAAPKAMPEAVLAPRPEASLARRSTSRPEAEGAARKGADEKRLRDRDSGPNEEVASGSLDLGMADRRAAEELSRPLLAEAEEHRAKAKPQEEGSRAADASASAARPSGGGVVRPDARAPAPAATAAFRSAGDVEVRRLAAGRLARLVPLAGGPARTVVLSADLASQTALLIEVSAEGRFRLVDSASPAKFADRADVQQAREKRREEPVQPPTLGPSDRAALDRLALPAGLYRIEAVQP